MKTPELIGILGGLGPMSSAYLYELITSRTAASSDQEHIDMIISSHASTPDRTAFITGKSGESPLPTMISDARRLEAYGADAIVIACNTAHYFIEEVRASVNVPVPSIIHETASLVRACGVKCAGIMATCGTVLAGSYQRELERMGIEWRLPSGAAQDALSELIYSSVKAGGAVDKDKFYSVAADLEAQGRRSPYPRLYGAVRHKPLASARGEIYRFHRSARLLYHPSVRENPDGLCARV